MAGWKLSLAALLLFVSASTHVHAQDVVNCGIWPVDYDPSTGYTLFYCEYSPVTGTSVDCQDWTPTFAWYNSTFWNWPELCPDCSSSQIGFVASASPVRLNQPLDPCRSLCSVVPSCLRNPDGACVDLRSAVIPLAQHDIQVRSADGSRVISVRLFDVKLRPCCSGLKGPERTIRLGFETSRSVVANCRPFEGHPIGRDPFQVTVDYHGQKYAVRTTTRMTAENLARAN
jgi:hypothetical protein